MDTDSKQDRIDDIFAKAVELPAEGRAAYLNATCDGDADVLAEVRKMLEAHERAEQSTNFMAAQPSGQRLFHEATNPQHPLVGQRVGPYDVIRWLGGGGFGHVYLGFRSDDYRQKVAIKVLRSDIEIDDRLVARFDLERQLLADLQHDHIARLLYGGTLENGRPYIVMEYVKGKPITEHCDARRLTVADRLALFRQVCEAVAYAHRYSVIHRDLKPGNILVTDDNSVKLLDFGIAKMVDPISQRRMVTISEGGMPLTPEYASPEQVRGEGISTASDVYSLGVVLYELLTGRRPYEFRRYTPAEFERVICDEEPRKPSAVVLEPLRVRRDDGTDDIRSAQTLAEPRSTDPHKLNRQLRGDLEQIVLMALRKEPPKRYPTVHALVRDIERSGAGQTIAARPVSRTERVVRWCKRNRMLATLSAAFLVALMAGVVISTFLASRFREQRDLAEQNLIMAEDAVEDYLTRVAGDERLKQDNFHALRMELLETAVPFYERFSEQKPGDAARETNRADAYERLASIHSETGQEAKSIEELEKAVAIQESLVSRFPDIPEYQAGVASNYKKLAWNLYLGGNLQKAENYYKKALLLYSQLATEHPDEPAYREGIAATRGVYGMLLRRRDDAAARTQFEQALKIQRELADQFPDEPEYEAAVAEMSARIGYLLRATEPAVALKFSEDAASIQRDLVTRFPKQPAYRTSLSATVSNLAFIAQSLGYRSIARAQYELAILMRKDLLADFPATIRNRAGLAGDLANFGAFLNKVGDVKGALSQFEQAKSIYAQLSVECPGVPDYRANLALAHLQCGELLDAKDHRARQERAEALKICEELVGEFPDMRNFRLRLAQSHISLGKLLVELGDQTGAQPHFERAVDVRIKMAADFPGMPDDAFQLAWAHFHYGRLLERSGELAAANEQYEKGVNAGIKLVAEVPTVSKYRSKLVSDLNALAWRLATSPIDDARDGKKAIALAKKSCELTNYRRSSLIDTLAAAYAESGDFDAAIKWSEKSLELLGSSSGPQRNEYSRALAKYKLKRPPRDGEPINRIAWALATSPFAGMRNGKRALELATRTCESSEYKVPKYIDTLAAAYAEIGDFDSAVTWSEKTLDLLGENVSPAVRGRYSRSLANFKAKRPIRQQVADGESQKPDNEQSIETQPDVPNEIVVEEPAAVGQE